MKSPFSTIKELSSLDFGLTDSDPYENCTTSWSNMQPKRVFELFLGLVQSPPWYKWPSKRTPVRKQYSSSTLLLAWTTEPPTDSFTTCITYHEI